MSDTEKKLTPEELHQLEYLQKMVYSTMREIGQMEVRKSHLIQGIAQFEQRGQVLLQGVAERFGIAAGDRWHVTPEGVLVAEKHASAE